MLKNYLIIAVRNLRKNKLFSLINIAGLAIGISAALVIFLIVHHQFSFEKFRKNKERVYRVVSRIDFPDLIIRNSGVPVPTAKAVRNEVTGLDASSLFITGSQMKVSIPKSSSETGTVFKKQKDIIYADNQYFSVFQYKWLAGSPSTALKDPFHVVLTESRAKNYFSNSQATDIIGRQINYEDSIKVTVSGVVKDLDEITDFTFKEFISMGTVENTGLKNHWSWEEWGSINSSTQLFVQLKPGTTSGQINKQLATIRNKYRSNKEKKDDTHHTLQSISDIHFDADYGAYELPTGHKPTLYGLLAVATFLLLLGCINFINLTTAQASQRAKEIGIRKTMGSNKRQLLFQFLGETFILTLIAAVLSIVLTPWLLKIFKDFIPEGVTFSSVQQPIVWIYMFILIVVVTALSGFYPSVVLSRFKPVQVLKNQAFSGTAKSRKAMLRKTLTVAQFVIAQFLVIATLAIGKQIHYSLNKDLGYKKEAIVFFHAPWNFFSEEKDNRRFALLDKLNAIPEIEKVSLSGPPPASGNTSTTTMIYDDGKKKIETMVEVKRADTNYFALYGMKLVAGRNLQQSDTTKEFVINESYARFIGFKDPRDAVGHFVDKDFKVPIVGVVKDFHTKSTHEAIKPLAYSSESQSSYTLHLALRPKGENGQVWKKALEKTEKAYKEIYPEEEFKSEFFDESIAGFYKTEQNVTRLLNWSSGLCIFISCLGLLGLVMFMTNQRTKEIGVRKVLGASVTQIISLLSTDFMKLVILAFVIATPLAYWALYEWLQDFVYRTPLSWWIFGLSGLGMFAIALLTLCIQTIKSARANPVKSLRTE